MADLEGYLLHIFSTADGGTSGITVCIKVFILTLSCPSSPPWLQSVLPGSAALTFSAAFSEFLWGGWEGAA